MIGLRTAARVLAWMVAGMLLALLAAAASFFVTLKVARSSNEVRVPKLIGLSGDEAADRAKELDLVLDIVLKRHDPENRAGTSSIRTRRRERR